MIRFFRSFLSKSKKFSPQQSRPRVEQLEDRYCPAAPVLSSFSAVSDGNWVTISGQVTDESLETTQIMLSGSLSNLLTPDSSGYFSHSACYQGSGEVLAIAVDNENLTSDAVFATLSPPPDNDPFLDFAVEYLNQRQLRITGQVTDENPGGLTVLLSGSVNTSLTTDSSGAFDAIVTADGLGMIAAFTMDAAGHSSNLAYCTVSSGEPVINYFTWNEGADNWYTFTGRVSDESAAGLTVLFDGASGALQGQSAIVQADGSFSLTVQLTAALADNVMVTAQVTDWWGMSSSPAMVSLPEDNDPTITFTVEYLEQRQVRVIGQVTDEDAGGRLVIFSGAASGAVVSEADGSFVTILCATELSTIFATTIDPAGQTSNAATYTLTSTAPIISNFLCSEQPDGWYEFRGTVDDESVTGLTIVFGGSPITLEGQNVIVLADGTFCLRIQLNNTQSDEGTASAIVTDWWGLESNLALCDVHQTNVS